MIKKDSSVAANNLRKIWDSRKSEIGITQTEAAKQLGGRKVHSLNTSTTSPNLTRLQLLSLPIFWE